MPSVVDKSTGKTLNVSDDVAARMLETGEYTLAAGSLVSVVGSTGARRAVDAPHLRNFDVRASTAAEDNAAEQAAYDQREYGDGIGNKIQAGVGGFTRGLSFGFLSPFEKEQAQNSGIAGVGEFAGILAPALLTGGGSLAGQGAVRGGGMLAKALALTPAGMVARGGARIAGATRAAGGAKALAGVAAAGAFEGAASNSGYYLSSIANGDAKLSAEGFVGAMGQGALWGGGAGAAFGAAERGLIRARSMFPRLAGGKATRKGAEAAEAQFATQTDDVMAAADEAMVAAKAKLASLKVPKAQAQLSLAQATKAGDKTAVEAARGSLRDINVQAAEARLTLANKGAPTPGATAPDVIATPGAAATSPLDAPTSVSIPGGAASADDVARAAGVADEAVPGPVLAEGSGPATREAQRLEARMAEYEARKADVGSWLEKVRGKADAGRWVKRTPEKGQWLRGNADLGNDIIGETPDQVLAWRRPHIDDITVREDYDDIIRRAAAETDEATRDAMAREAAELEVQAFDAAPNALNSETLAARSRLGTDPVELAKRRIQRDIDNISKMDAEDVAFYVTGKRHPKAGQVKRYEPTSEKGMSRRAGDDQFAAADAAMMRQGGNFDGVMDDATARVNRWKAEGKLGAAEQALQREGWRGAGRLTDEVGEGVEVIGAFERANADLVQELGEAAPPAAKALADDYAKAVDDQARKGTERMAQVADDVADAPIAEVRRGKKADAPKPVAEESSGRMGMFGDLAAGAEMLQTLGVAGIPDVDKIPVIGPILGMYLKVRAARAMVGKMGGRVPATAEAKVASKAAATRDKVATAVDRMLGHGATAARVGRGAAAMAAPRSAALAHTLFDDGESRPAPANDGEAVRHRIAELSAAQSNPDGVKRAVRRAMADAHDPDLVRAVEAAVLRKLQYLAGHMPKEPPPSLLGRTKWAPSKVEIDRFARRVKAAEDPASVFEDLADGTVTKEAADTLRAVYPELYAEAQMRLVERAGDVEEALPYQRVIKLSVLFDVPLLPSMRPERIAAYQAVGTVPPAPVPAPAQPMAGMQSPPDLGSMFMPAADRRAQRS